MCRQRWLAARSRTWLANGGVTKTTARSTSSSFNRSRADALRSEDTVTTNGDEWRAEAARDALAISTRRQAGSSRQVDAVGHPTSQLGHFQPETPDDDRWRRVRTQEPAHAVDRPRPD